MTTGGEEKPAEEPKLSDEEAERAAVDLSESLKEAILIIPEARDAAARAFMYGSSRNTDITFPLGDKSFRFSTWGYGSASLQIGEKGAFESGGSRKSGVQIHLSAGYGLPPDLRKPCIEYQDEQSFTTGAENPKGKFPLVTTQSAVQKVTDVINSLKQGSNPPVAS